MNQRRSFVVLFAVAMLFGLFVFSASAQGEVGDPAFQPVLPTELPTATPAANFDTVRSELTATVTLTPTVTPTVTATPMAIDTVPPLPRSASAFFENVPANPVAIGTEFTFEVGLDVKNIKPGVAGAEVYISYPANLVAPVASPGRPIAEVLPDLFGLSTVSVNEITACSGPDGAAACAHLVVAGPAQITRRGAIARYHFRPTAAGKICFTLLSVALADADGYPVTTMPTPPFTHQRCINVNPTVLGTVSRQGTPGNPNPGGGTLMCSQVKLSDGKTALTDVSGEFVFSQVTAGSYTIEASYSGYLKATKSFVASTDPTKVDPSVRLLGGDVNGDCRINILDLGSIISKFGASGVEVQSDLPDCADLDEPRDINDDGMINIGDVAIAAGNWNKVCPTPWLP